MTRKYLKLLMLAIMLLSTIGVDAKRGCSAFGHSCFGGHGKRANDPPEIDEDVSDGSLEAEQQQVYPGFNLIRDEIIPIRDGSAYDQRSEENWKPMKNTLRNLVAHWIKNRRSRLSTNKQLYFDNN